MSPARLPHLPGTLIADDAIAGAPVSSIAGYPAEQIALTVPLHDDDGLHLAVVPASGRLSLAKARRALRSPALRRATLEEARAAFPCLVPSAIPPFGAPLGVPVVADRRLFTYNRIVCASGVEHRARLVDTGDLIAVGGAQVADLCEARAGA